MSRNIIITYLDETDWDLATHNDVTYYRCNIDNFACVLEGSFEHDAVAKFFVDYMTNKQVVIDDIIVLTNTEDEQMYQLFERSVRQYAMMRNEQCPTTFHHIDVAKTSLRTLWEHVAGIIEGSQDVLLDLTNERLSIGYRYVLWQLQEHRIPVRDVIGVSRAKYQEQIISAHDTYAQLSFYQSIDWLQYFDARDRILALVSPHAQHDADIDTLRRLAIVHEQEGSASDAAQAFDDQLTLYVSQANLDEGVRAQCTPHLDLLGALRGPSSFSYRVWAWYQNHGFTTKAQDYYLTMFATYLHPLCFGSQTDHVRAKRQVLCLLEASYEPHIFIAFLKEISRSIDLGSKASLDPKYLIQRYISYLERYGFASDRAASSVRKFNALRAYYLQMEVTHEQLKSRSQGAYDAVEQIERLAKQTSTFDYNDWNQVYRTVLLHDMDGIMGTLLEVPPKNNTVVTTLSELERYTTLHHISVRNDWDHQSIVPLLFDFYLCDNLAHGKPVKEIYQYNDTRLAALSLDAAALAQLHHCDTPCEDAFQQMGYRLRDHFRSKQHA